MFDKRNICINYALVIIKAQFIFLVILNIYLNLYFHFFALALKRSAVLSSATQHAMPPEFGGKCRTECLNTA